MRDGNRSYPGVHLAVWNVTEDQLSHIYFPANFLKFVTTPILPVAQLLLNLVTFDAHHRQ